MNCDACEEAQRGASGQRSRHRFEGPGDERRLARSQTAREKECTASLRFHPSKVFEKPRGRFVAVGRGKVHSHALQEWTPPTMSQETDDDQKSFIRNTFVRKTFDCAVWPAPSPRAAVKTAGTTAPDQNEGAARTARRNARRARGMTRPPGRRNEVVARRPTFETAGRQSPRRPTRAGLRSTRFGPGAASLRFIFSRSTASLGRTRARALPRKAPRQPPATGAPEPPSRAREALPVSSPKDDGEDFAAAESRGIPPPRSGRPRDSRRDSRSPPRAGIP